MATAGRSQEPRPTARAWARRLAQLDWAAIAEALDARGHARLPALLSPSECDAARAWRREPARFRAHVDLARQRFGEHGGYAYFAHPLPALVRALRTALYARLAPIANAWQERLGRDERFPPRLPAFLERCRAHGQDRPTPLLLHYDAGGTNFLHQDRYGDVAFPLQVVCLLSEPRVDFEGGAFLLTEQCPRRQSRGEAIDLARGEALVFPGSERPIAGARGWLRAIHRHGVSRVRAGERDTLGLIFHDAR